MKCTDAPYQIWGDYDSGKTSNLQVVFDRCDSKKRTCKSEADITKWLAAKYIFVLQNARDYMHAVDDPNNRVSEYSVISQHPISNSVRTDQPMILDRTDVSYSATPWSINFNPDKQTIFSVNPTGQRLLPYDNKWQCAITFEHGKTLTKSSRIDYTILDLAS